MNFPQSCKHLRVYAFFETTEGTWKSYKDKVYSISGRKKEFTLTALNVNIKPYLDKPGAKTAGNILGIRRTSAVIGRKTHLFLAETTLPQRIENYYTKFIFNKQRGGGTAARAGSLSSVQCVQLAWVIVWQTINCVRLEKKTTYINKNVSIYIVFF